MSTRYVWNRYNLSAVVISTVSRPVDGTLLLYVERDNQTWGYTYSGMYVTLNEDVYVRWGTNYSISNGKFKISNSQLVTAYRNSIGVTICEGDDGDDYYFGISTSQDNSYDYLYRIDANWPSGSGNIVLGARSSSTTSQRRARFEASNCDSGTGNSYEVGKGNANGNSSNAGSSTYPPCDAAGRITSICAVLPIIRRCRDVQ